MQAEKIASVSALFKGVLHEVLQFWVPHVKGLLTAHSTVEEQNGETNIVTECFVRLRLFLKGPANRKKLQQTIKQEPFIQLSQYGQFTDAVVARCEDWFATALDSLTKESGMAKGWIRLMWV